jgi:hypothetical protein
VLFCRPHVIVFVILSSIFVYFKLIINYRFELFIFEPKINSLTRKIFFNLWDLNSVRYSISNSVGVLIQS